MILIDANILIYAVNADAPLHRKSRSWLESALSGPETLGLFLRLTTRPGNLTSDAHLAALAIEHGAELYSSDSDFARFPGLRWRNPLI